MTRTQTVRNRYSSIGLEEPDGDVRLRELPQAPRDVQQAALVGLWAFAAIGYGLTLQGSLLAKSLVLAPVLLGGLVMMYHVDRGLREVSADAE